VAKLFCECTSCSGTGLYQGMCEGRGRAVVCITCYGTGRESIVYKPFSGRRRLRGVQQIGLSAGRLIAAGAGASRYPMTYAEFVKKFPAPRAAK